VAVEKLLPAKFAKIKLRQDALQTPFSVFLDIFYRPNFRCFEGNGVFQHPQAITLSDLETGGAPVTSIWPRCFQATRPRGAKMLGGRWRAE
jgi:hypothetical protein